LYLWVVGGNAWENSNEQFLCILKTAGRCLDILSHKIKINNKAEIIEIIDPTLATKFHPA